MDSDEKKFSLDELPDEGSSSVSEAPSPRPKTATANPRKDILKGAEHDQKVRIMEQSWRFDKPDPVFGWVIYAGVVVALHMLAQNPDVFGEWARLQSFLMGIGSSLGSIILNPIVFLVFTPFLFKFRKESENYFEVTFDGISTVKKVILEKGEFPTRLLVKWAEIEAVEKVNIRGRELLQLKNKDGKLAQIIWDIDEHKKKGFRHLLKSLIPVNHPLRTFLEKDLA